MLLPLSKRGYLGSKVSTDISDTYITSEVATTDYTITSNRSIAIPVITSTAAITITPNDNVRPRTRFKVHDMGNNAATYPILIGPGGSLGKINTNGGSIEFARSTTEWVLIDKFENIWDRDEATNEIMSASDDQLVANKLVAGSTGEAFIGSYLTEFSNAESNVDTSGIGWGNKIETGVNHASGIAPTSSRAISSTGGNSLANCTDGSTATATFWTGTTDVTVTFNLGVTARAYNYINTYILPSTNSAPRISLVEGSTDGSSYSTLYSGSFQLTEGGYEGLFFDNAVNYNYIRITFDGSSTINGSAIAEIEIYESSYFSTGNTFQYRAVTGGVTKLFDLSTISPVDDTDTPITEGNIFLEYSTDGIGWSTEKGLNAFKNVGVLESGTLWLKFRVLGSTLLKQVQVNTAASTAEMDALGMTLKFLGLVAAKLTRDGIESPSGKFGDLGTTFTGSYLSEFSTAGANVDLDGIGWGNAMEESVTALAGTSIVDSDFDSNPTSNLVDGSTGTISYRSGNVSSYFTIDAQSSMPFGRVRVQHNVNQGHTVTVYGSNSATTGFVQISDPVAFTSTGNNVVTDFTITSQTAYRYIKVDSVFDSILNGGNSTTFVVAEAYLFSISAATTLNTFQYRIETGGDSRSYDPITVAPVDETDTPILDGSIQIEYSDDGSTWNGPYGLDAFKALTPITSATFWLRLTPVGTTRLKEIAISTATTSMTANSGGFNFDFAGNSVGAITPDGMVLKNMTTAERDAVVSPSTGLLIFNTTTSAMNFYNGSAWQAL